MNFFKKIFKETESNETELDDKTSIKACIALLLETSMADEVLDESELVTLKDSLIKDFSIDEDEIDELIEISKKILTTQTLYMILQEILMTILILERE